MKKRQQLNFYIEVYKYLENEDLYDSLGYLQKDGEIGSKNIYATNKSVAIQLSQVIESKGLTTIVKDIREEKDLKIKQELLTLMKEKN